MKYYIVSFDANHNVNVRYEVGSVKLSELQAFTAGTRTDINGNTWRITQQASYAYGRKMQARVNTPNYKSGLASVGLPSLTVADSFMGQFGDEVGHYILQKTPSTTVTYPVLDYTITSTTSSGVTYTAHTLFPKNSATAANTLAVSITSRSDAPALGVKYVLCPLVVTDNNGKGVALGAFGGNITGSDCQLYISWNTNFNYSDFSNILSVDSDNEPLEGEYTYDFTGDDIPMPGAPDETVSGVLANGFLNIYRPTAAQLRSFGGVLWTNAFNTKWYDLDSVSNLVLNAVSNPIDFIIGLFMLPVSPTVGGSDGIYLGGINVATVSAPRVTQQYKVIDFGTIAIDELYGNYLDYANSRVSIYLPYIGMADIDVQEINGGSVQLQYTVDCFTGACVANVRCVKATKTPWGTVYTNRTVHSYSGNMALQLPISASSFDTLTQGLINVGLGLGTNTPAAVMQGGKDIIQGVAGDVTTRGSLSSNTGKLGYQTPYLMFTRPIESRPGNLGPLHGFSAGVGGKLSSFPGYVICSDVKLDGVTATNSELNEIENILKSGVYV